MDTNTAIVLLVGLLALVAVGFLLVFRGRGKLKLKAPFKTGLELEGANAPEVHPGKVHGEDLEAGRDLEAVGTTGGDVEVKRARAKRDIKLGNKNPAGNPDPKA